MSTAAIAPFEGDDLPDWVNPFVVKELRQGLRSRIFVTVFVVLHTGVALVLGMGLLLEQDAHLARYSFSHGLQWMIESGCVCLLLPFGGFASVAEEMKSESLELIRVAGVSSGQVVMGKWQSLLCQATLLLISVIPYHLLQYYLHQAGPIQQLVSLYVCWLVSLFFGACTIFLGTLKLAGRIGCLFFGVPFGLILLGFVVGPMAGGMVSFFNDTIATLIIATIVWGSGVAFFLSLATSGVDMRVRAPVNDPYADWNKPVNWKK
jgi:ABC-type transport system involved in multi-copper enzyme maturation permease subunit